VPKKRDASVAISAERLKKIWSEVSTEQWLRLMSDAHPTAGFRTEGPRIKGKCPWHADNSPSFDANPSKGIAKCHGCGKTFVNPIKYVATLCGISYADAMLKLKNEFGLKGLLTDAVAKKYREFYAHRDQVTKLSNVLRMFLIKAMGLQMQGPEMLAEAMPYAPQAVDWLLARGLKPAWTEYPIGLLPPLFSLEVAYGDDKDGYDFARNYLARVYEMGTIWIGAIAHFMNDEPMNVARIKLRRPERTREGSKPIIWVSDPYENEVSFRGYFGFGTPTYLPFFGDDKLKEIHVVEGEYDALSIIGNQCESGSVDFLVNSLGGGETQGADGYLPVGIERVRIIPDRDEGGKKFVENTINRTTSDKISFLVFEWPKDYDANDFGSDEPVKDPDEAIKWGGYERFRDFVLDQSNWKHAWEWCYDRASEELARISPDDIRTRTRIASEWGRILKNQSECKRFADSMAADFGLDSVIVFREALAQNETEDAYIERIGTMMASQFHFIGKELTDGHRYVVHVQSKATGERTSYIMNEEKSAESMVAGIYGTLPNYIKDHIGDPAFMANEGDPSLMSHKARNDRYRYYINSALNDRARGLVNLKECERRAQGYHVVSDDKDGPKAYLINGRDVFKMTHDRDDEMKVSLLDGPSDSNLVFLTDPSAKWLRSVRQPEDISNVKADLRNLYNRVVDMVNVGWAWRHQAVDTEFLAAYIMCLPIMSLFPRQTSIMLTAEASSGKSRFIAGLVGGHAFPSINIVAAALSMDSYTAAGVRQMMDWSSRPICLDEFEDKGFGDKRSMSVRDILELYRGVTGMEWIKITIGSPGGQYRTYWIRSPLIVAGIRPLRDEASLSRFIMFEMMRNVSRPDPIDLLMEKFGDQEISRVRHELAVGLFQHVPAIGRTVHQVEKEYALGVGLPAKVPSRFKEALYPVLSIMKYIGLDYKRFAYDFCESRQYQLNRVSSSSENEQIFEAVLSTPFQVKGIDANNDHITIRGLLADVSKLDEINKLRCGVYLDVANQWLVVHWNEAVRGIFANQASFRVGGHAPGYFKQVSERSPYHIASDVVQANRVLEKLRFWMGPGVRNDQCTVFNVRHLIEEAARASEEDDGSKKKGPKELVDSAPMKAIEGDGDMQV